MDDRTLLMAYSASQAQSLADALNSLADSEADESMATSIRARAHEAQGYGDVLSAAWLSQMGRVAADAADRMVDVRSFLTDNIHLLTDRLDLEPAGA